MLDNTQPTPSSGPPPAHGGQDDSQSTAGQSSPRAASPQRDEAPETALNQRWENDLEADQTEHLLGDEAIEDRDVSDDEFPDDVLEDIDNISEDF
jgi:hypothetical protein